MIKPVNRVNSTLLAMWSDEVGEIRREIERWLDGTGTVEEDDVMTRLRDLEFEIDDYESSLAVTEAAEKGEGR